MSVSPEKTILVHLGERVRPVKFKGTQDGLILAICSVFRDVPGIADVRMVFQVGFDAILCDIKVDGCL